MSNALHIHLDPVGGIAGDMFIGAILDAWPELEDGMIEAIRAIELPGALKLESKLHSDDTLTGTRFEVSYNVGKSQCGHNHNHFRDITRQLGESSLPLSITRRAIDIFTILAGVEAKVHGVPIEEVSFHEVGNYDSIADIVGAAYLIDSLAAKSWSCSALPLGSGRIQTAHGILPLPAPATALLMKGFPVFQDEIDGERVTPTGAAIIKYIDPAFSTAHSVMQLNRIGTGFGSRRIPGMSNILRVLAFDFAADSNYREVEEIVVIAFEVDDQTPEDLGAGLDRLRTLASVYDVAQAPFFGKKGRISINVQLLAKKEDISHVIDACFLETSTLGVRWYLAQRIKLARQMEACSVDGETINVKSVQRPHGITTAKAELSDVANVNGGSSKRDQIRQTAENIILKNISDACENG